VEKQILLTGDPFEIVKQLPFDAAFSSRVDSMNGLDQKIDQTVSDGPGT